MQSQAQIGSLSAFFPCFNEEGNVERTTLNALRMLKEVTSDYELIIVNDGSADKTGEIADRLAKDHPNVRAVHHPRNLGYGAALQSGFKAACKEWVFYTDGDGQFDCADIHKLLPELQRFDIVSAYRLNRSDSSLRKLNAAMWTTLVNALLGLRLRDIDCAFKVYPRKLFDQIEMRSTGALIDAEILARAQRLGYTIGQVGVRHYPRIAGKQTGANLRVIARAFNELRVLRSNIMRTERGGSQTAPSLHGQACKDDSRR